MSTTEYTPVRVPMTVEASEETVPMMAQEDSEEAISMSIAETINPYNSPYAGPYFITPTNAVQTLETKNKRTTQNIVVGAIPNNYGLITWNGSFLTVS